jgi:hypothetical protein
MKCGLCSTEMIRVAATWVCSCGARVGVAPEPVAGLSDADKALLTRLPGDRVVPHWVGAKSPDAPEGSLFYDEATKRVEHFAAGVWTPIEDCEPAVAEQESPLAPVSCPGCGGPKPLYWAMCVGCWRAQRPTRAEREALGVTGMPEKGIEGAPVATGGQESAEPSRHRNARWWDQGYEAGLIEGRKRAANDIREVAKDPRMGYGRGWLNQAAEIAEHGPGG